MEELNNKLKNNFMLKWLEKEFTVNEWSDENRGNTESRFPLYDVLIVAEDIN